MKAQVVSFHCVLKNGLGVLLNTSFNRDVITHVTGAADEIPGLPARLQDVKAGERRNFTVKAPEAYGLYDPSLTRETSRRRLSSAGALALGDRVHFADPDGDFHLYRVTGILGDLVQLDANHPLAGQDLVFDVHIVDARDATPQELLESSAPSLPAYLQ